MWGLDHEGSAETLGGTVHSGGYISSKLGTNAFEAHYIFVRGRPLEGLEERSIKPLPELSCRN